MLTKCVVPKTSIEYINNAIDIGIKIIRSAI
jgi:hypothetical protein